MGEQKTNTKKITITQEHQKFKYAFEVRWGGGWEIPPYWLEKKEAKNQPENVEIFSYKNIKIINLNVNYKNLGNGGVGNFLNNKSH